MKNFVLKIGTPEGMMFEGEVQKIVCRTIVGDMAILAKHCNFCTAVGSGDAHIVLADGTRREAACRGGMLSMINGICSLMSTTWNWK